MSVQLADGSLVMSNAVCRVPLIACDSSAEALLAVVECRVVENLSHAVVLGMDWLRTCNPTIDWQAYSVTVSVPDGHSRILCGLPQSRSARIELASLH